ncbi:sigma-54 dependent transcriptional regulator, partial [Desulfovibrio sp. OttesenSCG-928-I05]|nr:sigma-54 dependent transcriptional regulator [Desulfovibrio sp. OttesenSCG-928-I05]
MKHILVIDDEAAHRLMVRAVMEDDGWVVSEAASADAALRLLGGGNPSGIRVIFLDIRMPGMSGSELLAQLRRDHPDVPVVMLTAFGTVGSAVEAMKNGAFDYLTKPADNDELLTVAAKALDQSSLLRENERLRARLAEKDPLAGMIGESRPMRRVKEFIRQAGPSEGTVLILGESGTGKELIADALHACSLRASKALVKVNCAALPENLLESELFGFQKGAFTGAAKDKPGRFQLADGGTLFLDEVGELPVDLQSKLLRAL